MIGSLGRVPSRVDSRTLKLSRYVDRRAYTAPPPARSFTDGVPWRWWLNDRLGCCTVAALAHIAQAHAVIYDEPVGIEDADIDRAYRTISGYDGTPATDRGAQMLNALVYAKHVGIGSWKLGAFVAFDYLDDIEIKAAINLGGAYLGGDLPRRIAQPGQGDDWTLPTVLGPDDVPRSLGGHAYAGLGYHALRLEIPTWARHRTQSYPHHRRYTAEGYALITAAVLRGDRPAPNGFDVERLRHDLEAIGKR